MLQLVTPITVNGQTAIEGQTFATDPRAYIRRSRHLAKEMLKKRTPFVVVTQAIYEHLLSHHIEVENPKPEMKPSERYTHLLKPYGAIDDCLVVWSPNSPPESVRFFDIDEHANPVLVAEIQNTGVN